MKLSEYFSALEYEQIAHVKQIGELYGNSPELMKACRETYNLYRSGKITVECYEKIYSDAFDRYFDTT